MQKENTSFIQLDYKYPYSPIFNGEENSGVIEVKPDETMTLREMVNRQLRGQRIPDEQVRRGYYDDDVDDLDLNGTNFNELDLSEKHEVIEAHRRKLNKKMKDYEESQYPKKTAPPAGAGGENHDSQSSTPSKAKQDNNTSEQSKPKGEDERAKE